MVVSSPNICPTAIFFWLLFRRHLFSLLFFHSSSNRYPGTRHWFYRPISLPLDHLLVVGSLPQLIHLTLFSLACLINIRHISSHKITFVGLEPQWYIAQLVVFTTRPLARCWKTTASYSTYFCLACVINIQHISSHKMAFVGLEPQWYIAQRVVFTTRPPLARCWNPT
jgi:hypothetical protein